MINAHKADAEPSSQTGEIPPRRYPALKLFMTIYRVIAWIWARTVKCPNPACGCEMPLASSFQLTSKKGKEAFVQPIIEGSSIHYEVKYGKNAPEAPKTARGAKFKCIRCGEATTEVYIRTEANAQRLGQVMIGIIAESRNGRIYLSPSQEQLSATVFGSRLFDHLWSIFDQCDFIIKGTEA